MKLSDEQFKKEVDFAKKETRKKEISKKILKIADAMYNLNRHISFNNIALKKPMTERDILNINRFIGEWIKQLREIGEEQ